MKTEQMPELAWQTYRAATEAVRSGHLSKASKILRQAIQEADANGKVDPLLISSADSLAEKYYGEGDYLGAAALFRTILESRRRTLGEEHPEVSDSRKRLEMALWQNGGITPRLLNAE